MLAPPHSLPPTTDPSVLTDTCPSALLAATALPSVRTFVVLMRRCLLLPPQASSNICRRSHPISNLCRHTVGPYLLVFQLRQIAQTTRNIRLAQSAEIRTLNCVVVGSNPTRLGFDTHFFHFSICVVPLLKYGSQVGFLRQSVPSTVFEKGGSVGPCRPTNQVHAAKGQYQS